MAKWIPVGRSNHKNSIHVKTSRPLVTFRSGILSILTHFLFFYSNFQILYRNIPELKLPLKGKPSVLDQKRENLWPCGVEMFNIHMFFRKWWSGIKKELRKPKFLSVWWLFSVFTFFRFVTLCVTHSSGSALVTSEVSAHPLPVARIFRILTKFNCDRSKIRCLAVIFIFKWTIHQQSLRADWSIFA